MLLIVLTIFVSTGCEDSGPVVANDQVLVHTGKIDVTFSTVRPFSGSYLVFGGATLKHSEAFFNVSLAALDIGTARSIYARYPDFDRCSSAGAPLAQQSIDQLDIVPANANVRRTLQRALSLHRKQTRAVDENVCVTLTGRVLTLQSAVVPELDQDISGQLPRQVYHEYYLVESAEIATFSDMLAASLP